MIDSTIGRINENKNKTWRRLIWILLLVFMAIGSWYSLWNPLGEGIDEIAHFKYVLYIKEHHALPIQPWQDNGRLFTVSMGHHPPLYYTLGAILISGIDTNDCTEVFVGNPHFSWGGDHPNNGWNVFNHTPAEDFPWHRSVLAMHVLRGFTLLLGAIALYAVYRIGCQLFPSKPWLALTGTAWLAFNPSFIYMTSTIHHDAFMAAVFSLALWWLISALDHPPTVRQGIAGGLLLAAAMLTKLSGLVLVALFGCTFFLLAIRKHSLKMILPGALSALGVATLVAGWWYIRNWILYGDPFGWAMFKATYFAVQRNGPFTWHLFTHEFLYQLAQTFWGAFGYMHITLPEAKWIPFWIGSGILILSAFIAMVLKPSDFFSEGRGDIWLVLGVGMVLLFASFIRFAFNVAGAGHARYLFPGIAGFVMLLAVGSHALLKFRLQPLITALVSVGLAAYAIWLPVTHILPLYPRPEIVTESDLALIPQSDLRFAQAVQLRGYRLTPGDELGAYNLALYWQPLPGERADLYAHLQLQKPDGTTLLEDNFWPIPSFSTIVWDPDTIYVTRRPVQIPQGTPALSLTLSLELTEGACGQPLGVRNSAGENFGFFAPVTSIILEKPIPISQNFSNHRSDVLEYGISLLGYDLPKTIYSPGETLSLTLFWQSSQKIASTLVVFTHLLNPEGQLVAQHDGTPNQGASPTPFWQPGTLIPDLHEFQIPPDLPAGEYTLSVGMYEWPDIRNLHVVEGPVQGQERIVLEIIKVD